MSISKIPNQERSGHGTSHVESERLSVRVDPALKRKLQNQAKRAGLPLAEWLRIRLQFGPVNPREVRAFLTALVELGTKIGAGEARR